MENLQKFDFVRKKSPLEILMEASNNNFNRNPYYFGNKGCA